MGKSKARRVSVDTMQQVFRDLADTAHSVERTGDYIIGGTEDLQVNRVLTAKHRQMILKFVRDCRSMVRQLERLNKSADKLDVALMEGYAAIGPDHV